MRTAGRNHGQSGIYRFVLHRLLSSCKQHCIATCHKPLLQGWLAVFLPAAATVWCCCQPASSIPVPDYCDNPWLCRAVRGPVGG